MFDTDNQLSKIIQIDDPEKTKFEMKQSGEDRGLILPMNGLDQQNTVLLPSALGDLGVIFQEILNGNEKALNNPAFQSLNFDNIKAALEWLAKTDNLSDSFKTSLLSEGWRLNYKCKPPTPEEFLSIKYIGPTAETLFEPIKKAFIEFMDPLKPYRNGIWYSCIGTGKSTLTALVNLYISTLFAMMWHPYKYFGLSSATVFVQALGAWSQKKGSEILLEPIRNIIESSPYFTQVRGHADMTDSSDPLEVAEHLKWTTATKTAQPLDCRVYLPDGTYKLMGDIHVGDKIASPTHGEVTVEAIPYHGIDICYEIELEDGRKTRCNAEHLWKVSWEKDELGQPIWKVVQTQFMIDHPELEFEIFDVDDCDKNN